MFQLSHLQNPMYEQVVGHCLSQGHPVDAINVDRELLAALRITQGNIAAQAYRQAAPNATGFILSFQG